MGRGTRKTPRSSATAGTVIAIDGSAASGKSSTAAMVADALGFRHLDSGALYRAATFARLQSDADSESWTPESVLAATREVALGGEARVMVATYRGRPLDVELRSPPVNAHVSRVAQMPDVRAWVNDQVRRAAVGRSVVVDGRDIGAIVFPNANLKVFLVADPWERARRRLLQQRGSEPTPDEIAEETDRLVQRDARDATQSEQARDAVRIDTTHLTQPEQVARIVALARAVTHRHGATFTVDAPGT